MLIEAIIALLLGIFAGTLTGLIPGIHINLVGSLLVSLSSSAISFIAPVYFVVFIVAMAIAHTFIDFIPSIFLGCPDTDTELSVLPGHKMLKKGYGYQAISLTALGGLAGISVFVIISFPSLFVISKIYNLIKILIPYILILISLTLIFSEKKKILSLVAFLLSGTLGLIVLNLNTINQPLLPLLTGLFGASNLILSIRSKTKIPKQETRKKIKINFKKPLLGSVIASPLTIFLPALGSGQIAIIGNQIARTNNTGFLFLLGATNILTMAFSFLALYTISKTRTGATVAVQELIGKLSINLLILISAVILITGIICFFLTKFLARFFSQKINRINYSLLSLITLGILFAVVFIVSGAFGLIILVASAFTGIYCISLNVKRTNMMGCLLLPTILLYLF